MNERQLLRLLKENEGPLLDFKEAFYDIEDKKSKTDFVKDILSFSNTTLNEDGYIICGVSDNKEIIGIDSAIKIPDSKFVQALESYADHPVSFSFEKVFLQEYEITLIVITISQKQLRPVLCKKPYEGKLQEGAIYYRYGSVNSIAKDFITVEKIVTSQKLRNETNEYIKLLDSTYNKYSKFPAPPYSKFLGREDIIAKVYDNLINHHKIYLLSLTGDGGVGKTSLAYKVADEIRTSIDNGQNTQFDGVIWISAKDQRLYFDERKELFREFNSISDVLNKILLNFYDIKAIKEMNEDVKNDYLKQILNEYKFFFVLDNLEVFSENDLLEIYDFIESVPLGHKFLLTSRHHIRVPNFEKLESFDIKLCEEYIKAVSNEYEVSKDNINEIWENLDSFYFLTGGNPLYIRFFISQIKKGRTLKDILERRNRDSEKSLKTYCFDSTLDMIRSNEIQLKLLYSISSSQTPDIDINTIKYIASLHNDISAELDNLNSLSLINSHYSNNKYFYRVNNLFKDYLLEEKRIPLAEYSSYRNRAINYINISTDIDAGFKYNFGLEHTDDINKLKSFSILLEIMNSEDFNNTAKYAPKIEEAKILYPGNFLLPVYKSVLKMNTSKNKTLNTTDININFVSCEDLIYDLHEKRMLTIWKSIMYLMIGNFQEVTMELKNISSGEHDALINMLIATAYNYLAYNEYNSGRTRDHDELRDIASNYYEKSLEDFLGKSYFFFLKYNFIYAYKKHSKVINKDVKFIDFKPYTLDAIMFKDNKFLTSL